MWFGKGAETEGSGGRGRGGDSRGKEDWRGKRVFFFFFFFHLACVMEDQINMLIESVKFPDLFGPEIFLLMIFFLLLIPLISMYPC